MNLCSYGRALSLRSGTWAPAGAPPAKSSREVRRACAKPNDWFAMRVPVMLPGSAKAAQRPEFNGVSQESEACAQAPAAFVQAVTATHSTTTEPASMSLFQALGDFSTDEKLDLHSVSVFLTHLSLDFTPSCRELLVALEALQSVGQTFPTSKAKLLEQYLQLPTQELPSKGKPWLDSIQAVLVRYSLPDALSLMHNIEVRPSPGWTSAAVSAWLAERGAALSVSDVESLLDMLCQMYGLSVASQPCIRPLDVLPCSAVAPQNMAGSANTTTTTTSGSAAHVEGIIHWVGMCSSSGDKGDDCSTSGCVPANSHAATADSDTPALAAALPADATPTGLHRGTISVAAVPSAHLAFPDPSTSAHNAVVRDMPADAPQQSGPPPQQDSLQCWVDMALTALMDVGQLGSEAQLQQLYAMLAGLSVTPSTGVVLRLYADAYPPAHPGSIATLLWLTALTGIHLPASLSSQELEIMGLSLAAINASPVAPPSTPPPHFVPPPTPYTPPPVSVEACNAAAAGPAAAGVSALQPAAASLPLATADCSSASAPPQPSTQHAKHIGDSNGGSGSNNAPSYGLPTDSLHPGPPRASVHQPYPPAGGSPPDTAHHHHHHHHVPPPSSWPSSYLAPESLLPAKDVYLVLWSMRHHEHRPPPHAAPDMLVPLMNSVMIHVDEFTPSQCVVIMRALLVCFPSCFEELMHTLDLSPLYKGWDTLPASELLELLADVAMSAHLSALQPPSSATYHYTQQPVAAGSGSSLQQRSSGSSTDSLDYVDRFASSSSSSSSSLYAHMVAYIVKLPGWGARLQSLSFANIISSLQSITTVLGPTTPDWLNTASGSGGADTGAMDPPFQHHRGQHAAHEASPYYQQHHYHQGQDASSAYLARHVMEAWLRCCLPVLHRHIRAMVSATPPTSPLATAHVHATPAGMGAALAGGALPPAGSCAPLSAQEMMGALCALHDALRLLDGRRHQTTVRDVVWALQRLGARAGLCTPRPGEFHRVPEMLLHVQRIGWTQPPVEWLAALLDYPSTSWFEELSWGEVLALVVSCGLLLEEARMEALREHGEHNVLDHEPLRRFQMGHMGQAAPAPPAAAEGAAASTVAPAVLRGADSSTSRPQQGCANVPQPNEPTAGAGAGADAAADSGDEGPGCSAGWRLTASTPCSWTFVQAAHEMRQRALQLFRLRLERSTHLHEPAAHHTTTCTYTTPHHHEPECEGPHSVRAGQHPDYDSAAGTLMPSRLPRVSPATPARPSCTPSSSVSSPSPAGSSLPLAAPRPAYSSMATASTGVGRVTSVCWDGVQQVACAWQPGLCSLRDVELVEVVVSVVEERLQGVPLHAAEAANDAVRRLRRVCVSVAGYSEEDMDMLFRRFDMRAAAATSKPPTVAQGLAGWGGRGMGGGN